MRFYADSEILLRPRCKHFALILLEFKRRTRYELLFPPLGFIFGEEALGSGRRWAFLRAVTTGLYKSIVRAVLTPPFMRL